VSPSLAPEVAFAGAPIQPVPRPLAESEHRAECLNLLPFTPGHVHCLAGVGVWVSHDRQRLHRTERRRLLGQCGKRGWRGERGGMVVRGFGIVQRTAAQPSGQLREFRFPRQLHMREGPRPPQRLVLYQKRIELAETFGELRVGEGVGRHGGHRSGGTGR